MPLKYTNTKATLKIEWTNEEKTQSASFTVPKEATDQEQVKALLKALAFLGAQTGVVPPAPTSATVTATPSGTTFVKTAESAAVPPGPSTGPRVPMMPPASLPDRPADGGVPGNLEFWQNLPTMEVPKHLALNGDSGWEMIPPGEA